MFIILADKTDANANANANAYKNVSDESLYLRYRDLLNIASVTYGDSSFLWEEVESLAAEIRRRSPE